MLGSFREVYDLVYHTIFLLKQNENILTRSRKTWLVTKYAKRVKIHSTWNPWGPSPPECLCGKVFAEIPFPGLMESVFVEEPEDVDIVAPEATRVILNPGSEKCSMCVEFHDAAVVRSWIKTWNDLFEYPGIVSRSKFLVVISQNYKKEKNHKKRRPSIPRKRVLELVTFLNILKFHSKGVKLFHALRDSPKMILFS